MHETGAGRSITPPASIDPRVITPPGACRVPISFTRGEIYEGSQRGATFWNLPWPCESLGRFRIRASATSRDEMCSDVTVSADLMWFINKQ